MKRSQKSPWRWVPSLYYAEGLPYTFVMLVSVIMYKRMGVSNTDIALYTSWLYLPWVIKPLWSPIVDILRTKRFWIIASQLVIGASLGGIALAIPLPDFFKWTLTFFWLLAFSSATHDIAIDGFYMLGLSKHDQAWFVGFRTTFYRLAMITGQGLLIILAGYLESTTGVPPVDIKIQAVTQQQVQNVQKLQPVSTNGNMKLICEPQELKISTTQIKKDELDAILKDVKKWNLKQGQPQNKTGTAKKSDKSSSWLDTCAAIPIENFLRKNFGETKPDIKKDIAGNAGIIYIRLSEMPDRDTVVNLGRHKGDKSISLIEGSRFVFTKDNWDKPVKAVIQLDPKLKQAKEAVFQARSGNIPFAWTVTFSTMAVLFFVFFIYHKFILPYPEADGSAMKSKSFVIEYFQTFRSFFTKERIWIIIAFFLIYRFGEAQLVKLAAPFLLDTQEAGGLGLTTSEVGFLYGTIGLILLTIGGILGGFAASRHGLKFWIWWMALAMKLPDAVYVYLAYTLPDSFLLVNLCVAVEQFGYGFGFTAYTLYMIYAAEGEHKTSHFAICTGFMALGMMIPGMFSGWLQEIIGYKHFFIWVLIATIPGLILLRFLPLDSSFGKKIPAQESSSM